MAQQINPNLKFLCENWFDPNINGVVLEGSSRSGKTWSVWDFLIWLSSKHIEGKTINIIRETYNSFKTTLYKDANDRFPDYGLISPFADVQERATFKLYGNQVNLIGADKPSKFMGAGCDILWVNEGIHVPKKIFDQAEMRCSMFFVIDYNPESVEHWIYDNVIKRDNVKMLKTTFKDNPFIPKNQLDKILSYDPNNPKNQEEGTADEYMWDVFGLGKRAKRQGAIIKRWRTGKFDETLPSVFGIDWGFTDPFTLVEVAINYKKKIIYVRQRCYAPGLNMKQIKRVVTKYVKNDELIVCDSAEPLNIRELDEEGFNVVGCWKAKGSVVQGLRFLQEFIIIVEDSSDIENELNNYVWADKKSETPVDKFNHTIDPLRYCADWYRFNMI